MFVHGFDCPRPGSLNVNALVAEIVLQLDSLELLHCIPCLQEKGLLFGRIGGGFGLLQQQIRQFKEKRPFCLAERQSSRAVTIAERNIVADGLQRLDGTPIGRNRRFGIALRLQQPAGLPFPAIQGLRHLRLLSGEGGATGERQSGVGLLILLVKLCQVPERISFDRAILNLFRYVQSLLE